MSNTPYDHGPDRRAARNVPLPPPSAPERAAQTCSRRPPAIRSAHRRGHLARPKLQQHQQVCPLPGASTANIQKFALRQQAEPGSAIE